MHLIHMPGTGWQGWQGCSPPLGGQSTGLFRAAAGKGPPLTSNGEPALPSTAGAAAALAAQAVLVRGAEVVAGLQGEPSGQGTLAIVPWEGRRGGLQ